VSEGSSLGLKTPENAVMAPLVSVLLEHGTPSITVDIGVTRTLIVDTGSSVSLMQPSIPRSEMGATPLKPYGVTGEALDIRGQQTVSFRIGGREFKHKFLVCSLPTEAAGLIGTDFMNGVGAKIDFGCGKTSLSDVGKVPRVHNDSGTDSAALTVFVQSKEGHSPQLCQRETWQTDVQF
jgi:hypothetical protein